MILVKVDFKKLLISKNFYKQLTLTSANNDIELGFAFEKVCKIFFENDLIFIFFIAKKKPVVRQAII